MNISGKSFKAVIFDLDNTLADRKYAFEMHSKKLAELYLKDRSNEEKEQFVRRMIVLDKNGYAPKSEVYGTICREFSPDGTPDELFSKWRENAALFTRQEPFAEEILIYLKDKYRLSLLTNGSFKTQSVKLESVGLRNISKGSLFPRRQAPKSLTGKYIFLYAGKRELCPGRHYISEIIWKMM